MMQKRRFTFITSLTGMISLAAADVTLPPWDSPPPPGEAGRLGGLLWPQSGNGGLNVDAETGLALPPGDYEAINHLADSPGLSQPNVDISGFLLPSPKSKGTQTRSRPPPTPTDKLVDLTVERVNQCYSSTGEQYILDPGYQLSELERDDFERFLAYHARDSRIEAHVLFLAKNERLPADMSLARISGGALLKENSCLLVLPVGESHRARLFFTNNIHQAAPSATLAEILSECIKDSQLETDPVEQVHRMLVKLSIRLFWLDNYLVPVPPRDLVTPEPSLLPTRPSTDLHLTEVQEHPPLWASFLLISRPNLPYLLAMIGFLAGAGFWAALRWHRYKLRSCQWILPPAEEATPQRLGGRFSGAAGAALVYR